MIWKSLFTFFRPAIFHFYILSFLSQLHLAGASGSCLSIPSPASTRASWQSSPSSSSSSPLWASSSSSLHLHIHNSVIIIITTITIVIIDVAITITFWWQLIYLIRWYSAWKHYQSANTIFLTFTPNFNLSFSGDILLGNIARVQALQNFQHYCQRN